MEEENKQKKEITVVKVPTEYDLAFQTLKGDLISDKELLARIANDIEEIKKNLVG